MPKETLKHEWMARPAFDKRSPNPKKNYGIHGLELRYYVKGKKGAVQFILYTNWQLPHVDKETFGDWNSPKYDHHMRILCKPMPADLGYHSPVPMYEGHEPMQPTKIKTVAKTKNNPLGFKVEKIGKVPVCEVIGVPCYYDGSSMNAERIFDTFVTGGDIALWKELEDYYYATFN